MSIVGAIQFYTLSKNPLEVVMRRIIILCCVQARSELLITDRIVLLDKQGDSKRRTQFDSDGGL